MSLGIQDYFTPDNSACQETAAILSEEGPVRKANEFREPPYPKWAGLTFEEVKTKWQSEWDRYWEPKPEDADEIIVPEGESLRTTYERAKCGLDRLHTECSGRGTIVVVTHGEIVRLLTVGLLGSPLTNLFRLRGRNGAVTIFDYDRQHAVFECINDTSHLAGLAARDLSDSPTV